MLDLGRRRLYGILDLTYIDRAAVVQYARQMIKGGVDLLQLRAKTVDPGEREAMAVELFSITRSENVPLIINDHPDIVSRIGADGVHVGQDDVSVAKARSVAGRKCVVGKSTHSLEQAVQAEAEGADYIGFGPIFATPTKPDYQPVGLSLIRQVRQLVRVPVFCIGGIKLENLNAVTAAGGDRVVIVSGLLLASDVASYARSVKEHLVGGNDFPGGNQTT